MYRLSLEVPSTQPPVEPDPEPIGPEIPDTPIDPPDPEPLGPEMPDPQPPVVPDPTPGGPEPTPV